MEKVQLSLEANAPTAETASLLISLLDQLINDCRYVDHTLLPPDVSTESSILLVIHMK